MIPLLRQLSNLKQVVDLHKYNNPSKHQWDVFGLQTLFQQKKEDAHKFEFPYL